MRRVTFPSGPIARGAGRRDRERGAALIIGLVLLLAVTVLGISGMKMSTLELAMASNRQSLQAAFECAETGIDLSIAQPLVPAGMDPLQDACDEDAASTFRAETTFVTTTLPPDGAFSTDITAYHFDTESEATGPRNAVSVHVQSTYVLGPTVN